MQRDRNGFNGDNTNNITKRWTTAAQQTPHPAVHAHRSTVSSALMIRYSHSLPRRSPPRRGWRRCATPFCHAALRLTIRNSQHPRGAGRLPAHSGRPPHLGAGGPTSTALSSCSFQATRGMRCTAFGCHCCCCCGLLSCQQSCNVTNARGCGTQF